MISTPTPPLPQPPPPPPNPPLYGANNFNATGQGTKAQVNPTAGFGATILGQTNPTNTGQKTLLGQ